MRGKNQDAAPICVVGLKALACLRPQSVNDLVSQFSAKQTDGTIDSFVTRYQIWTNQGRGGELSNE